MPLSIRVRWLSKAGNRADEYEDACWPTRSYPIDEPLARLAVADGATESAFAGRWARQLARAWGEGGLNSDDLTGSLAGEQTAWQAAVDAQPLPWYAEEKARSGAFAALLGVTVDLRGGVQAGWAALAVGDCVLFHVRGNRLARSFPAEDAAFFTNRPLLISSRPERNLSVAANLHRATGGLEAGDRLYLATDALGQWFMQAVENGGQPWDALDGVMMRSRRRFASWADGLRARGVLRNDDVTVLSVEWQPARASAMAQPAEAT